MNIPITQSKAWQKLQDDLGETSFFEKQPDFQYLAIKKSTPTGNYLYLPYGPVFSDKTGFKHAIKSLQSLAQQENAIFIRIEPQDEKAAKWLPKTAKKSKDLNPAHTLIIDINREPAEILSAVPRRTRGYFNTYEKKGLTVEVSKDPGDIKHLVALQKILAKDKKIGVFSEDYLKTQLSQPFSSLYLVKYHPENEEEKVIAAVLVFDDQDTRYYIQAAQDKSYTKLAAPSIVVCKMLLDAKEKGLEFFDFWGIAPENAPDNHPWKGFTNFKKSFGGTEKSYAGTYDIILNPVKYKLYGLARKVNRFLRRV
ncbi:peptidoglycan bridge formation glycyltransferase FemA/FemB family protein [Candidatus Saccharibacteria bacterium]|nr:peptidoglycan bridge formation glycyltransferase FemA/FemB family protein [Candidatus Saccharibacteria bacterium]